VYSDSLPFARSRKAVFKAPSHAGPVRAICVSSQAGEPGSCSPRSAAQRGRDHRAAAPRSGPFSSCGPESCVPSRGGSFGIHHLHRGLGACVGSLSVASDFGRCPARTYVHDGTMELHYTSPNLPPVHRTKRRCRYFYGSLSSLNYATRLSCFGVLPRRRVNVMSMTSACSRSVT
jgi:hypothetical protein